MSATNLKLSIELVPAKCWGKNLRTRIKRSQWRELRKKVCAGQGGVCCICGAGGKLFCHEIWAYDDERHVQTLTGFRAICGLCNYVTHFGLAFQLAGQGQINIDSVIEHFMTVNGVGRAEFQAHAAEANREWRVRSGYEWQTGLGEWAELVHQSEESGAGAKDDSRPI